MTLRVSVRGTENLKQLPEGKRIYCGWHGKSLIFENHFRKQGIWVIISPSKDGDIQASLFRRMGYQIIRGSTGREGAKAAIESIKVLREGGNMAMTPDGPRGPACEVQPGVITLAEKSGAVLVPTGIAATRKWTINSWDKHLIPKLFTRAIIVFGEPVYVPNKATEQQREEARLELQKRIMEMETEAEKWAVGGGDAH